MEFKQSLREGNQCVNAVTKKGLIATAFLAILDQPPTTDMARLRLPMPYCHACVFRKTLGLFVSVSFFLSFFCFC